MTNVLTLGDLPPPPEGRTGWPWTEASSPLPPSMPNGVGWPRISIVTPSYNQGDYLEETIRSVLLQGYPNLEYFIMDGGSSDQSVAIIRKYEQWLTGWVSEADDGQSAAINEGFSRCTGDIFNWLCSDDLLTQNALSVVALAVAGPPSCDVVVGNTYRIIEEQPEKNGVRRCRPERVETMPYTFGIYQPSCFYARRLIRRADLVKSDLHYAMDRELWCHLHAQGARWRCLDDVLSISRMTGSNKTSLGGQKIIDEVDRVYRMYVREMVPLTFLLRRVWLPFARMHIYHGLALVRAGGHLLARVISFILRLFYPTPRVRALQTEFLVHAGP